MRLDISETVAVARWWWTFILRGALAIAFGIVAFLAPMWGVAILIGVFIAWALIDGVTSLFTGIRTRTSDRNWWLAILEGIVGIAVGVIALFVPWFATQVLVILIGAWAIVTGIVEIVMAIRLREQIKGEFWMGLAGVASILFGVLLFVFPRAGVLSLVWLIGAFAIVFGGFLVILGWRLRTIDEMAKVDAAHDYSR
ncbi:MAG TPA: HdeD family acid-resistance protein [Candidatus Limnocylindria bacterium]|nr:HdeD family acid-resistance protein [Candidatus Limnocylindria bacterium]